MDWLAGKLPGYIYFAMAFSVFVEMLDLRLEVKAPPVQPHEPYVANGFAPATPQRGAEAAA